MEMSSKEKMIDRERLEDGRRAGLVSEQWNDGLDRGGRRWVREATRRSQSEEGSQKDVGRWWKVKEGYGGGDGDV